jgi:type II secretory pathway predicted ATPase ExeA
MIDDPLGPLFGLKFHPFRPDVPVEALHVSTELESFLFRVEQQVRDGGFVSVVGDPGTGKSAALRVLAARLARNKDLSVGVLTRPQSNNADFYRELGHLFGVSLSPHNRWAGSKVLRETWLAHIDHSRTRPVLLVDEAQEMKVPVLAELRLLSSMNLDARALLTVVLAGDERLTAKYRAPDVLPIASRIRTRLHLGYLEPERLRDVLDHLLEHAGRPDLITHEVKHALATHAHGNLRSMATMADNLLAYAQQHELDCIDEQAFFDVFQLRPDTQPEPPKPRRGRRRAA